VDSALVYLEALGNFESTVFGFGMYHDISLFLQCVSVSLANSAEDPLVLEGKVV
jgi:hypothetical protein